MAAARVLKVTNQGALRLYEASTNGQHYTSLQAPSSLAASVAYTLPSADGSSGHILSTNGSGTLSWLGTLTSFDIDALTSDGITILDQGELRLREATGGGTNYTAFKAAAAMAGNVTYTLPDADGAASTFLQTNGSGTLTWAVSTATMQSAYDNAEDITFSAGNTMTFSQANDETVLAISKSGVGAGYPLSVSNAGTGAAINISQTGAAYAIAATPTGSAGGLRIHNDGSSYGIYLNQDGAQVAVLLEQNSDNYALSLTPTSAASGGIDIDNDGTLYGISVQQDGNQIGLYVEQNNAKYAARFYGVHANSGGLQIQNAGAGGYCLNLDQDGDQVALYISHAPNQNAIQIAKAGAGAGAGLYITNAGTGPGAYIAQNGAGYSLSIVHGAVATNAINLTNAGTGYAVYVQQTGSAVLAHFNQDAATNAVEVNKAAGNGSAIDITNVGSGVDIDGHSSNWYVRPGGGAVLMGLTFPPADKTIDAAGAIAVTKDDCFIRVIPNGGIGSPNDLLDNISGGTAGQILIVQAKTTAAAGNNQITVRDAAGNILHRSSANMVLDTVDDKMLYIYDGSNWCSLSDLSSIT